MLPVARRPSTSQFSMSVACADRQHEDPRLAGALDDAQRVNVRGVLDSGREAPRTAQAEAAGLRDGGARPRALTGNHRQAFAAEQFGDRFVAEVGRAGADRERRRHQHPARRRVAVRDALEDFERRDRVQLGAVADRPRHPHAEEALAVQRLDDGRREMSLSIAVFCVFVGDRRNGFGPRGKVDHWRRSRTRHGGHVSKVESGKWKVEK